MESCGLPIVLGWEALNPNCVICDHSAKMFLQMSRFPARKVVGAQGKRAKLLHIKDLMGLALSVEVRC